VAAATVNFEEVSCIRHPLAHAAGRQWRTAGRERACESHQHHTHQHSPHTQQAAHGSRSLHLLCGGMLSWVCHVVLYTLAGTVSCVSRVRRGTGEKAMNYTLSHGPHIAAGQRTGSGCTCPETLNKGTIPHTCTAHITDLWQGWEKGRANRPSVCNYYAI